MPVAQMQYAPVQIDRQLHGQRVEGWRWYLSARRQVAVDHILEAYDCK